MFLGVFVLALGLLSSASVSAREYSTTHYPNIAITTWDGKNLYANAMVPTPSTANETFPVIIMTNSWGVPSFEYLVQTFKLAGYGFIVLEYAARGWYRSEGEIGTAGPLDQKDISSVIDWVLAQQDWNPDPAKIAMCGISYGGGLALLGAATDVRVTTAVAMSGWGSILDSLDEGGSPNLVWGSILVGLAGMVGHPSPELEQMWQNLLTFSNRSDVEYWCNQRSAEVSPFLDSLNKRKIPIMLSNNYQDEIFKPQDMLRFFTELHGPKKILLNQGIHATAELGGLLGISNNFVWKHALDWLRYFLRGEGADPTSPTNPGVIFQLRNPGLLQNDRIELDTYPSSDVQPITYYLSNRGTLSRFGGLEASPSDSKSNTITFGKVTGMSDGIPIMGELLQVWTDIPILADLLLTVDEHSIVFSTSVLLKKQRLCGDVTLKLPILSNSAHWQINTFLYDMDDITHVGKLISIGTHTCANCTSGVTYPTEVRMRTLCYDMGALRRLALGVNLYSDLHQPVNSASSLAVTFSYGEGAALVLETQKA